jgi:SAM-dependent methyltransferase
MGRAVEERRIILETGTQLARAASPVDAQVPTFDWRRSIRRAPVRRRRRLYAHPLGRAHFIIEEFGDSIGGSVLDVGGGSSVDVFKKHLDNRYYALDLERSYKVRDSANSQVPDKVLDLEDGVLPFEDRSFDTVICTDVLEHVDNIYAVYDELFRVAARHVIISLPNNWPGMIGSFLVGHNQTHSAGYGLPPQPKVSGQRHKYFFNLEEACDFLIGRTPPAFSVRRLELRFEQGNDGLLYMPPAGDLVRRLQSSTLRSSVSSRGAVVGAARWIAGRFVYWPLKALELFFGKVIWGWGSPVRFYNLFCRQVWVVFERSSPEQTGNI